MPEAQIRTLPDEIEKGIRASDQKTPTTLFVPLELRFFNSLSSMESTGIQSKVKAGEIVIKMDTVRKHGGAGLTQTELFTLAGAMNSYRVQLERAGLNLPLNLKTGTYIETGQGGDNSYLYVIDQNIKGNDIDKIIKAANSESTKRYMLEVWLKMVDAIVNTLDSESGGKTKALIDAKPANFVVSTETERLYYVDVFPPLLRDSDGLVYPYIESVFKRSKKLVSFNFGDIRGMITKMLALAQIEYPEQFPLLSTATLEALSTKLPDPIFRYIQEQVTNNFPDMKIFYSKDQVAAEITLDKLLGTT